MEVFKKDFQFRQIFPLILSLPLPLIPFSLAYASIQEDLSSIQSTLNSLNQEVSVVDSKLDQLRRASGLGTAHDVFHRALLAFRAGRFEFSTLGFDDFLVLYPRHKLAGSARFYLAESYFERRNWAQALENYQSLLRQHPENKHSPLAREHLALATEKLKPQISSLPLSLMPDYTQVNWSSGVLADAKAFPLQIQEKNNLEVAAVEEQHQESLPPQTTAVEYGACEAFDWKTPVTGAMVMAVTKEGRASDPHWERAEALDHFPTLLRSMGNNEDPRAAQDPIPLISMNTAKMISALSGAALQQGAGIVFGKIGEGYSVRISGRSERAVFLNSSAQAISSQELSGDRYFAFLNVEPGAHLLYFVGADGAEKGAVGITSLEGVATYTDLSRAKAVQVSGRVFDGSHSIVKTISGAEVRVLGSPSTRAQTDSQGSFSIEKVLVVGNYPVYFETDYAKGFTHRYQVMPAKLAQVDLFRMSDRMIQEWMGQLAGSISPESGVLVAAAPNLVSEWGNQAKLNVGVSSLASNPVLKPEVYTVSAEGSLEVDQPLSESDFRFFSVQLPAGPLEVKINDSAGHLAWSQLLMASPAVINVVGPL